VVRGNSVETGTIRILGFTFDVAGHNGARSRTKQKDERSFIAAWSRIRITMAGHLPQG
jgi:hypothetical protein